MSAGLAPACWCNQGSPIGVRCPRPDLRARALCLGLHLALTLPRLGLRFWVFTDCGVSDFLLEWLAFGKCSERASLRPWSLHCRKQAFLVAWERVICSWRERGARECHVRSWREKVAEEWLFCQGIKKPGMRWTCAKAKTFPRLPCSYHSHSLTNEM